MIVICQILTWSCYFLIIVDLSNSVMWFENEHNQFQISFFVQQVGDTKALSSWSTKLPLPFSCPVIFDQKSNEFVGICNKTVSIKSGKIIVTECSYFFDKSAQYSGYCRYCTDINFVERKLKCCKAGSTVYRMYSFNSVWMNQYVAIEWL